MFSSFNFIFLATKNVVFNLETEVFTAEARRHREKNQFVYCACGTLNKIK